MWLPAGAPSPEGDPGGDEEAAALSRRMQVPLRLRLRGDWEGASAAAAAALVPMQVPERLCLAEMLDDVAPCRPLFSGAPPGLDGEQPPRSPASSSSSGAQKRKRSGPHPGRGAWKERGRPPADGPLLARQRQDCSREVTLVLESSLEEFGPTDILALRNQLLRISGRLQALEEQSMGWRQKQLLFYSVLVSACVLNMWLWLRR